MSELLISKKNEVYLKIECEPHIKYELSDQFTFDVPEAAFMPSYRSKHWDGKIRLFSPHTGEIYCGLLDRLITWCGEHEYKMKFESNKYYGDVLESNPMVTMEGVKSFMSSITSFKPRDYQVKAVYQALKNNRKLIISPTASGKSMMIYSVVRYHVAKGEKILIVVPTTSLVEQMYKDFIDYGWDAEAHCHKIYAGYEKISDKDVTITTWQSIYKMPKKYFDEFTTVIGDEAHQFKAKSLTGIMTKCHNAKYRIGFTGTLDGTKTHKWVLEGLFGPADKIVNTEELIDQGYLSKFEIKVLILKHEYQKFETYEDEIQFLINNDRRNKFISNLALDLKGNTLILYSRVSTHGQVIYDLLNNSKTQDRKVFFIHGGVNTDEREDVRKITESENNAIIVASYGTFSTGINIKNLHNVIFSSPSKSRIRNLQSIGRVLRKGQAKNLATLYDVSDDVTNNNGKKNYTLNHLVERIKIYNEENFDYQIINIDFR
ncbi:RNA-DNA + DNA-DNA helicase [Synechococcus phage S-BM3]|nr:RNA-DNA + DNA-DNA helicase [Synechococcus phage S-BM3]